MFESKYLNTPDELNDFNWLKKRFFAIKNDTENSISQLERSLFSGKHGVSGDNSGVYSGVYIEKQLFELRKKQALINQIEPLLVPEYKKLTEFCFYFNNGHFRTEEEIKEYKSHKIKEDWFICDEFNKQCFWIMATSAFFALLFLMIPYIIMGRGAIMLYLIPVWPLIAILTGFGTFKILKKIVFDFDITNKKNMRKVYTADTALSFMRKFY